MKISNKNSIHPLTIQEFSHIKKEPVWSNKSQEWFIVFDYIYGNKGDFVSLIDKNQELIYINKDTIIKEEFYDTNSVTKIGGGGDLLYCESCGNDLSPAYVENIDDCFYCKKIFTNVKDFR